MNKILKYILMGLFILLLIISLIKFVLIYIFIYFSDGSPKNPSLYRHLKDSVIIFFKSIKYDMINLIDYIK